MGSGVICDKGNCNGKRRFPSGMTTRETTATATATATANANANANADSSAALRNDNKNQQQPTGAIATARGTDISYMTMMEGKECCYVEDAVDDGGVGDYGA